MRVSSGVTTAALLGVCCRCITAGMPAPEVNKSCRHYSGAPGAAKFRHVSTCSCLLRSSLQQGGLGDVRIEMPAPPGEALAIAL
jgi:hypothetical protein